MSSTNRGSVRTPNDYYLTNPKEIVKFLLAWLATDGMANRLFKCKDLSILDPAAGGLTERIEVPQKEGKPPLVFEPSEMPYPAAVRAVSGCAIQTMDIRENSRANVKGDFLTMKFSDYRLGVDQEHSMEYSSAHAKFDSKNSKASTNRQTLHGRDVSDDSGEKVWCGRDDDPKRHEGTEYRATATHGSTETVVPKGSSQDLRETRGAASAVEGRERTSPIPQDGDEGKVRQMRRDEEPVHPPQGLRPLQQRPEEFGGALRQLSFEPPQERILEGGATGRETEGVHSEASLELLGAYDVVLTNPPFALALEYIKKSLTVVKPGGFVVMLLRLNFFGSEDRNSFFLSGNMPQRGYVHSKRLGFTPDGKTDSVEYCHFVWQKTGEPNHETKLRVLPYR